jgi:hypothetical protein
MSNIILSNKSIIFNGFPVFRPELENSNLAEISPFVDFLTENNMVKDQYIVSICFNNNGQITTMESALAIILENNERHFISEEDIEVCDDCIFLYLEGLGKAVLFPK